MKMIYPYLKDDDFLIQIDTQRLQTQYIKLVLLNWNEEPIQEIQGIATSGSVSVNGNSAVRRTCSLSMTVDQDYNNLITNVNNLISINKKLFLEIGIKNITDKYTEYPILWYPQGTFVITSCSINSSIDQGISLSVQLKDKMCLLNGECGGTITSSVILDRYDTLDASTGKMITTKVTIAQLIKELVNHFGKIPLDKIIINDIDEKIKMVMKWTASQPIYLTKDNQGSYLYTTNYTEAQQYGHQIQTFNYGQDIGFTLTDFVYPNDLIANAGDTVCTILDKIKNLLTNYEYYFDIDGNFIFQEIKNYLNTTQATIELEKMQNEDYMIDTAKGKSVYSFMDAKLITGYANNPNYNNIKNDFVVWGVKEDTNKNQFPIRYHLAIDTKPTTGNIYEVFFYDDPTDGIRKAKVPVKYLNRATFPVVGNEELFYLDLSTGFIYKWDAEIADYVALDGSIYGTYDPDVQGQEGIIYVDENTFDRYVWKIIPGSEHYNEVMAEIDELTEKYEGYDDTYGIKADQENIAHSEEYIITDKATIEALEEEYAEERKEQYKYEKMIELLDEDLAKDPGNVAKIKLRNDTQEKLNKLMKNTLNAVDSKEETLNNKIIENYTIIATAQQKIKQKTNLYETEKQRIMLTLGEYTNYIAQEMVRLKTNDWRSELYLSGVTAESLGLETNYYYQELKAEWPKLYNLQAKAETDPLTGYTIYTGDFYDEVKENPWNVDYWLDFIDSDNKIGALDINNIGRRSIAKNNKDFNCVFEAEVPDIVIIEIGPSVEEQRQECEKRGQDYCQVSSNIYSALGLGGRYNSCFNEIKNLLWENTSYNSNINITIIPIYHLEPNTRITVQSIENDIHGDFIMNSFSIPLTINGTMNISATQVQTKL